MNVSGWHLTQTHDRIIYKRERTVYIRLRLGRPAREWRDGFRAVTPCGLITWMAPGVVEQILERAL